MKLLHYSDKEIKRIYSRRQEPDTAFPMKPQGLWVSVEGEYDWAEWCAAENFRDTEVQFCYEIKLKSEHNVLMMSTAEELRAFSRKYVAPNPLGLVASRTSSTMRDWIDWKKVVSEYQGVIIAPYLWECRMELFWYYGWDCASGFIWDKDAIESHELVRPPRNWRERRRRKVGKKAQL